MRQLVYVPRYLRYHTRVCSVFIRMCHLVYSIHGLYAFTYVSTYINISMPADRTVNRWMMDDGSMDLWVLYNFIVSKTGSFQFSSFRVTRIMCKLFVHEDLLGILLGLVYLAMRGKQNGDKD